MKKYELIYNILTEYELPITFQVHMFFEPMSVEELSDSNKVLDMVEKVRGYVLRSQQNNNKYPEEIMMDVRINLGLDSLDDSMDDEINLMTKDEVFNRVCVANGLLGSYSDTIKRWVEKIYRVKL